MDQIHVNSTKAITSSVTDYEGELEALKLATDHALSNLSQTDKLYIYMDPQSAVKAIMAQSRESYHDKTRAIWENLMEVSQQLNQIKMI